MATEPTVTAAYHDLIRQDIFPIFPEKTGRLLDLGGGIGATAAALKEAGRAERIVVADLVADHALPQVDRAYGGNLEDPAFLERIIAEEGPFDAVLCLDVLEHLRDPWGIIATLRDGLNPGGVITASIPNVRHYRVVWPLVTQGRFDLADKGILDRTHLRWFTRKTAGELMSPDGMVIEEMQGKLAMGPGYKWANRLSLGLLRGFCEIQYLVRARKTG
jgi:2-polyprenyl-3-methyl-5-hydroxy-6-metoxy-1,4-benzoquinol methylase